VGATCLRLVESKAGIGDCDRTAQKVPDSDDRNAHTDRETDIHTHNPSII